MNDFLPQDYNVPTGPSNYMNFEQGPNKFRILTSPVLGYKGWGNKKPIRKRMNEDFPIDLVDKPEEIKHFWAMPVYNYKAKRVQVLEITQKGLMKSLKSLASDEVWGSPTRYDIIVTKEGEYLDTEYQLIPSPPMPISEEVAKAIKETPVRLEALFEGKDTFEKAVNNASEQQTAAPVSAQISKEEVPTPSEDTDVNVEDIPF